jgi:hypothetical protein
VVVALPIIANCPNPLISGKSSTWQNELVTGYSMATWVTECDCSQSRNSFKELV